MTTVHSGVNLAIVFRFYNNGCTCKLSLVFHKHRILSYFRHFFKPSSGSHVVRIQYSFVKEATIGHFVAIILYNTCLVAARGLSIVFFLLAFKWITSAVLAFHGFVCISIYLYRNHEYFTENEVWWIAFLLMPCYIFVYLGFKVKELNSKLFDIKLGRSIMSSGLFYTCFIAENVFMIVMFFTWSKTSHLQWRRWITNIITASVVLLSFIGTLIHLIFTHRFFSKPRRVMPTYAAESVEVYQDGTIQSRSDLTPSDLGKGFSLEE